MWTAMLRCQSLVTFSVILWLRSVTQYIIIAWKNRPPEEEDWAEMDYCFLWQHFPFPFSWPHFFSCLSLRGNSGKTAGPYVATRLGEQQRSAQHWQHAEHSLLQQQCHLTRGQLRSSAGLCVDIGQQRLNVKRIGLVASEKNEERFFYRKKKTTFSFGEATVCVSVYMSTQCMSEHSLLDLVSMLCYMWQSY